MSKGLVLVTGINGFIGAHVAKDLLEHGWAVRGTARKPESVKVLTDGPFKKYADEGKFTLAQVPDMTVDGAFDEAVKGMSYC